jgi:hypothetical protein
VRVRWVADSAARARSFCKSRMVFEFSCAVATDIARVNNTWMQKHQLAAVSNEIAIQRKPIGFLFRVPPLSKEDSGWVIMSDEEPEGYLNDGKNMTSLCLQSVAALEPAVAPLLDAPLYSAFERVEGTNQFQVFGEIDLLGAETPAGAWALDL